jgi:hypothetical protein
MLSKMQANCRNIENYIKYQLFIYQLAAFVADFDTELNQTGFYED